ncbi:RHS repeat-associated core domain-containing protein [Pelagerythrobacter marensis]|uniref:RHS repeat-associated core domain-containing protein n=1 Tax=Pelagerythrobacter marensis TaxID=543877 RepID=A0ABZ2D4L1_9SPHN
MNDRVQKPDHPRELWSLSSTTYAAGAAWGTQATQSNDAYAFDGLYNVDRIYTVNGRNQLTSAGGVTLSYDTRGNLTNSGTDTFAYTSENLLTGVTGAASLAYDPLGRLWQVDDLTSGGPTTRFGYDGIAMIGEYNTSNQLLRRYVHGPGIDSPIVWYEGSGTTNRRFLHADERGSIIAVSNASGALLGANAYDEYGIPADDNLGRFQYTGQVWLEEAGLYYYKARMYSPTLGRFLQTDPIGYADGMNLYNYVGSDPANFVDPLGLCKSGVEWVWNSETKQWDHHVVVCADTGRGGGSGGKDNGGEGIIPPSGPAPSPSPEDGFGGGRLPPQREEEPSISSCAYDAVAEDPTGAALAVLGGAAFVLSTKARIVGALVGGTVSVAALGYSAATKDGIGGVISLAGKGTANAGGIASVGSAFARGAKVGGGVTAAAGILYEGQKIGNRFVQCRSGS